MTVMQSDPGIYLSVKPTWRTSLGSVFLQRNTHLVYVKTVSVLYFKTTDSFTFSELTSEYTKQGSHPGIAHKEKKL